MKTKADFLRRLATAVHSTREGTEPVTQMPPGIVSNIPNTRAWGWANDTEIFIEDPTRPAHLDIPVVRAIEYLAGFPLHEPLTLEKWVLLEGAWEYFERAQIRDDNLKKTVEEIEWSVRTYNCLKNANVSTIDDLVKKTEKELLAVRNFGRKPLQEVKNELASMNLYLKADS